MKPSVFPYVLVLAGFLHSGVAMAERADRDKPMNIEADALRYDDNQQTSVFTGKVVLTKGTMLIRGARLDVRQDTAGNQFGVVRADPGKLAFFRQKRDTRAGVPDEFMEGEAEVIEYDGKLDTVRFVGKSVLRRFSGSKLNDEIVGSLIVYDNSTSILTVDGGAETGTSRVRAMLSPRASDGAANTAPPAGPPPVLRRSGGTVGDKK